MKPLASTVYQEQVHGVVSNEYQDIYVLLLMNISICHVTGEIRKCLLDL